MRKLLVILCFVPCSGFAQFDSALVNNLIEHLTNYADSNCKERSHFNSIQNSVKLVNGQILSYPNEKERLHMVDQMQNALSDYREVLSAQMTGVSPEACTAKIRATIQKLHALPKKVSEPLRKNRSNKDNVSA